jgi:antitoxin MazE
MGDEIPAENDRRGIDRLRSLAVGHRHVNLRCRHFEPAGSALEDGMQTTVSRWGNSLALRLPRHVADEIRLVEGTLVNLEVEDGSLRVTPSRKKFKLADLLSSEEPSTVAPREVDWGEPRGDETW